MQRLIGKAAPKAKMQMLFEGEIKTFDIKSYVGHRLILFFFPWDYCLSCPEELNEFINYAPFFKSKNTKIVVSVLRKKENIKNLFNSSSKACFSKNISVPILIDEKGDLAKAYQVVTPNKMITYRALFLIDEKGIVRQELINDLEIGRSAKEMLRVINCLDEFKKVWGEQKSY